jgi:hypothetical protein
MLHISEVARGLPQEKRSLYLQRLNTPPRIAGKKFCP